METSNDAAILARILKGLFKTNVSTAVLVNNLAVDLGIDYCVMIGEKPIAGKTLYNGHTFNLEEENLTYGVLLTSSLGYGQHLAETIKILVQKEFQKKRIATEVLGLYREINMIYNFSELIAEKIDDVSIAETALQEASQIITSTHGVFFMLDPVVNTVSELAAFGKNPVDYEVSGQYQILKGLIEKGNAAIVPPKSIENNPALKHLKSVMFAPLRVKHRTLGLIILGHSFEKDYTAAELKLLTTIALQSAAAIESAQLYQKGLREAREREEAIRVIHEASQKFVPHTFIQSLGKNTITEVALGDLVEREVTVMFVDIRGFTTLSETMAPKENFYFINSFNKRMGPIIRKNDGLIMQYLGDGFMALFPKGPQAALRAAVAMQAELQEYNKLRLEKGRLPVNMGIGMQNGPLIMGITGDDERMDAAIIADTVNTAARIEGLSKYYGTSILLTGHCIEQLTDSNEFHFRYLGPVKVKGKDQPIELYECINGDTPHLMKHKIDTLKTFENAMDLYFNKEFAMAAVTFQKVVKKNDQDHTSNLFLNRSAHLITKELEDDWRGVEAMDQK